MFFKSISVTRQLSRGSKDYDNSQTISFELATTSENILEISSDCVLCAPGRFRIHYEKESKRTLLQPTLTIYRDKNFDDILSRKMVGDPVMKDAMGFATFSRDKEGDSFCSFSIPVNAQTFDTLEREIVAGVTPTEVFIQFCSPLDYRDGDPKKLEFGWEPDGSRQIWNVPDGDQTDYLPIESVRFTTSTHSEEDEDSHPDDALPVKSQTQSLAELTVEAKKANECISQLSKATQKLVWLVAVLGAMILFKFML